MAWNSEEAAKSESLAIDEATDMLAKMTPEQMQGVRLLVAWWRRWFNGNGQNHATGHKALARWLLNHVNNPK